MKELLVNSAFKYVNKNNNFDHYNQVKIKYGLEVMYHFITKTFVILLLSIILHTFKTTTCIMFFYSLLRIHVHGIHAKSNVLCWITSLSVYVFLGLIFNLIEFNYVSTIATFFIELLSIILWAPADTPNRPLLNKNKRTELKIRSLLVSMFEIIIFILFKNLRKVILLSFLITTVIINPFIYKITKTTFNNYRFN